MKTVGDFMTRTVFTVLRDATLADAAAMLSAHGIDGAPVCDPHGRIVGMVSKGDLAEGCYNARLKVCECVCDVMSLDVIRVRPSDDIETVSKQLVFEGAHRAVVVDERDAIVGIITPLDVLRTIVQDATAQPTAQKICVLTKLERRTRRRVDVDGRPANGRAAF